VNTFINGIIRGGVIMGCMKQCEGHNCGIMFSGCDWEGNLCQSCWAEKKDSEDNAKVRKANEKKTNDGK